MIELPQPTDHPETPGRRGLGVAVVVVLVVVVLVVALVNGHRNRSGASRLHPNGGAALSPVPSGTPSPGSKGSPSPGSTGTSGNGGGVSAGLPMVACPQIRDEQSHLGYSCIDNYLRQDESDTYLGLRISLDHEVEPGWVISEGSGNPQSLESPPPNTVVGYSAAASRLRPVLQSVGPAQPSADQVSAEVRRRTELALTRAYGDDPASRTLAAHARSFGGVAGYEVLTEITMNPAYRASRKLTARTERLWTVGLPTQVGVSIFMMSIPDNRADLWPKAEAVVGTVHVL